MARSLQDVLGMVSLTTFIETVKPTIPRLPFGALYGEDASFNFSVNGEQGTYVKEVGRRLGARTSNPGAKSTSVSEYANRVEQPVTLLRAFENQPLNPTTFKAVMENPNSVSDRALRLLQKDVAQFYSRFPIAVTNSVHSMLANSGIIYRNSAGQILPSSSGAATGLNVDYGVPTGRKGATLGGLIAASWATASTDIVRHLMNIQALQARDGKPPITTCLYGAAVPGYISANTNAKEWINGNQGLAAGSWRGTIPQGFGGIQNWIPVHTYYMSNVNETTGAETQTALFGENYLAFLPDPTPDYYNFYRGSQDIATTTGVVAGNGISGVRSAEGAFAYGKVLDDPARIVLYGGDTWLPVLADPDAVFLGGSATAS
jgi:hypothetical protein